MSSPQNDPTEYLLAIAFFKGQWYSHASLLSVSVMLWTRSAFVAQVSVLSEANCSLLFIGNV